MDDMSPFTKLTQTCEGLEPRRQRVVGGMGDQTQWFIGELGTSTFPRLQYPMFSSSRSHDHEEWRTLVPRSGIGCRSPEVLEGTLVLPETCESFHRLWQG
jgi:hypothetical protein